MHTQTIHCLATQCPSPETTLTIAQGSTHPPIPTHCPWCGATDLVDDTLYHKLRFIQSLDRDGITISTTMYDKLYARFRAQSAFSDLREFIEVVLFDAPVETDKARTARLADERKAREPHTRSAFKDSRVRQPGTPLIGQFGGSAYTTRPTLPKAGK